MRIDVHFSDRVGIAQEILAVLSRQGLDLTAVEVDPPHIFIDAPALTQAAFESLRDQVHAIDGVRHATVVAMLPGAQRRLYLDALLASQADPILAVDADGTIVVANAAAARAAGCEEVSLLGASMRDLLGDTAPIERLIEKGYALPLTEVELGDASYLLESFPLRDKGGEVAGAVLTLHSPHRIGERLSALQNFDAGGFDSILGHSPQIEALKQRAARMAQVDAPLLISGETGTGKELIAHACHAGSRRRGQPFFALNCAAMPENLAESELFGYAPGAFTGALRGGKPGLLELCEGGTLFLDEVGEMSPYLQAKLLRFLNDGSFRRIGGDRELRADVRVISATHRALENMVAEGSFRQDLLFRLNVLGLHVPPLRERSTDILLLAEHFLTRACAQAGRPKARLTSGASAALLANPWIGNVRQLQNVIFRAVTMSERTLLDADDLELAAGSEPGGRATDEVATLEQAVAQFESELIRRLYPRFPSSRLLAGRLGTSHSAIAARLRKYGIPDRQR
ncbi:MAG: sigma 54-interacting transcriptional regulator [Rhodocyclaceae bacterium]|nr:sigma 54-interacting transcriptional regulator [Rhodocyclaceae bacterium]